MWLCNDADDGNDNDDDYNNNNMKSVAIIKYKSLEQKKEETRKPTAKCKAMEKGNQFETNIYGVIMKRVSNGNINEAPSTKTNS